MENTVQKLRREMEQKEATNRELKEREFLLRFAERVGSNIMIMLANIPFEEWPDIAKTAFAHEKRKTPPVAALYMQRLNKQLASTSQVATGRP